MREIVYHKSLTQSWKRTWMMTTDKKSGLCFLIIQQQNRHIWTANNNLAAYINQKKIGYTYAGNIWPTGRCTK